MPKDRFVLSPSLLISAANWAVLLHPGSTNSSGVIRVAAATLDLLMAKQHPADIAAAKEKAAAEAAAAAEGSGEEDEAAPAKKRKLELPPQRLILAGGGSLAAMGTHTCSRLHVCEQFCLFQLLETSSTLLRLCALKQSHAYLAVWHLRV